MNTKHSTDRKFANVLLHLNVPKFRANSMEQEVIRPFRVSQSRITVPSEVFLRYRNLAMKLLFTDVIANAAFSMAKFL